MPVSLQGRVVVSALRLMARMNPDLTPHPVSRIDKLSRYSKWHHVISRKLTVSKETTEDGVRYVRLRLKNSTNGKTLFFIHGGVFIADLHPFYINTARRIMLATGCSTAILPDYGTLPAYSYPTQLNEVKSVWNHCTADISPSTVIVSGDSAGGNLALALLLTLRDAGRELPGCAALFSPWLDMLCMGESYGFNYEKDAMFGNKTVGTHVERRKRFIESEIFSYAKGMSEEERRHPYVSPVYGDYHGMPPMFLAVGEHELLLSDSETVAEKLRAEGITAVCEKGDGMFHIYALFPVLPEARKALDALRDFTEKHF